MNATPLTPELYMDLFNRHQALQATVEALQASKGVVLAGDYEALAQRHRHLEQQMEALQRERDEANLYRDQARANQESLAACVDRDVRKIKDLQAALDAEREKVKGLAQQVQDQSTANLETMRHTDDMQSRALDAERALAQLQALVRAAASAPGKDWLEWQLKLGEALDAMTPAVCPDCNGEGAVDSGGTDPNGNPLMRWCGCREKGGDGE